MSITITECPACRQQELKPYLSCTDHTVSHESFQLVQCETCGLIITSPQPDEEDLPKYYQSENYISHTGKGNNPLNRIYLFVRQFTIRKKVTLVKKYGAGTLLDVGCGTGTFLTACQSAGLSVQGIEPLDSARHQAEQLLGQSLLSKTGDLQKSYDVITLWHVLEHLPHLNGDLAKITQHLNPGGKLIIAVPNPPAQDAQYYNAHWAAYDVPRHLWHFNRKPMAHLLQRYGLTITKVLPMPLDAYYVSLLSEQYKHPHRNILYRAASAVLQGYRSNTKASTTGEFSSLIYIAQR